MEEKYIEDLPDSERDVLKDVVRKENGKSQNVKRAQISLEADETPLSIRATRWRQPAKP